MRTHNNAHVCQLVLVILIAANVLVTAWWLRADTRPPRWDEAGYLTVSLRYYEALTEGGISSFFTSLVQVDRQHPPLVSALAVPAYLLFGNSADAALAVNVVAYIILLRAVYGIGTRLASPQAGIFAAVLVSTYPSVFSLSRIFLLDFFHTALVALSLYLLLRSEGFSRRRFSLALGVAMGLGWLCRAFFPIFMVGPLGISLIAWRKARTIQAKTPTVTEVQPGRYLAHTLAAFVAVAGPWYLLNFKPLTERSLSAAYGVEAIGFGPEEPLRLTAWGGYLIRFINLQTSLLGTLVFLVALIVLWRKRAAFAGQRALAVTHPLHGLCLLGVAIVVPYLFFSTLPSQDHKNITPISPAMAVVSAWGLSLLARRIVKRVVVIGITICSLFQYSIATYGCRLLPPSVDVYLGKSLPWLTVMRQGWTKPTAYYMLPVQEHWPIEEILFSITGEGRGPNGAPALRRPAVVMITPDYPLFNVTNFAYFSALNRLPLSVQRLGDPRILEGKAYRTMLLGADFAVVKTGEQGDGVPWFTQYNEEIRAFLQSPESGFVEVRPRFPLPDGSEAILYAAEDSLVLTDAPAMQFPVSVRFSDEIELLGYDIETKERTDRGRAYLVTYYWRALRQMPIDYQVFTHITAKTSPAIIANWAHLPARGRYPTSRWQPGMAIKDRGLYFLAGNGETDEYVMRVGIYRPELDMRLPIAHAAPGVALDDNGTRAAVGVIRVPGGQSP